MNILITGAGGFVGNALTKRLLREGHNLIVSLYKKNNASSCRLDNQIYLITQFCNTENLSIKKVTFLLVDLKEEDSINLETFKYHQIDLIIHAAAETNTQKAEQEFLSFGNSEDTHTIKTNVGVTRKLITLANEYAKTENKKVHFIYLSTIEVDNYSNRSHYVISKRKAEIECHGFSQISTSIIRVQRLIGSEQNTGGLSRIREELLTGEKIRLKGTQEITFSSINSLLQIIHQQINMTPPRGFCEKINQTVEYRTTISSVLNAITTILDKQIPLMKRPKGMIFFKNLVPNEESSPANETDRIDSQLHFFVNSRTKNYSEARTIQRAWKKFHT